ncbi:hypothetical protein DFJ73DRAFT_861632 [Zopfochytrium polystomum]|nr:hypothetical protein DFJ73DRAFT_861632 [Zopfochytrium polystomum]
MQSPLISTPTFPCWLQAVTILMWFARTHRHGEVCFHFLVRLRRPDSVAPRTTPDNTDTPNQRHRRVVSPPPWLRGKWMKWANSLLWLRRIDSKLCASMATSTIKGVAVVGDIICTFVSRPTAYRFATLFRQHNVQAHLLTAIERDVFYIALHRGRLDLLQFLRNHLPENKLRKLYAPNLFGMLLATKSLFATDVLRWWIDCGLEAVYERSTLPTIKFVPTLELCKEKGLITSCDASAMDDAEDPAVLQWWKESGLELVYTSRALLNASRRSDPDVLEWWRQSGLELKLDDAKEAIQTASAYQFFAVLNWWKASGLEFSYSADPIDEASSNGRLSTLQWWKRSGLVPKYTQRAMDEASENGFVKVLQWWKDSGLEMKYTDRAMDGASKQGRLSVLQWWKDSGLPLRYTDAAIDNASEAGHVAVLEWWNDSGLDLRYTELAMDKASERGFVNTLQWWWKTSGLPLKYSKNAMDKAPNDNGNSLTLQWWRTSGLVLPLQSKGLSLIGEPGYLPTGNWSDRARVLKSWRSAAGRGPPTDICEAIYDYDPENFDEIALNLGDLVEVMFNYEDGWSMGTNLRTGCIGLFPLSWLKADES